MKYRGQSKMSKEFLEQMLGLPEDVELKNIEYDQTREVISFVFRSEEEVKGYNKPNGEGQEPREAYTNVLEDGIKLFAFELATKTLFQQLQKEIDGNA
jgi:hypothetical protein